MTSYSATSLREAVINSGDGACIPCGSSSLNVWTSLSTCRPCWGLVKRSTPSTSRMTARPERPSRNLSGAEWIIKLQYGYSRTKIIDLYRNGQVPNNESCWGVLYNHFLSQTRVILSPRHPGNSASYAAVVSRWLRSLKGKFVYRGPKPYDPDRFTKAWSDLIPPKEKMLLGNT